MAGIYIHIPFCKKACHYCNFHFSTSLHHKNEMMESLLHEIVLQKEFLGNKTIESIYIGGGTPSLLSSREIQVLIHQVKLNFNMAAEIECTLEANPDDISAEKIRELVNTGINRLSIGIQSFYEEDLQYMNRGHNADQAERCIQLAIENGIPNFSIDLIFGYPLLTDEKWHNNIEKVLKYSIPHISCYGMTVEPKTVLASMIARNKLPPLDDETGARQYEYLMNKLVENGYEHYEISNFAKSGLEAKHNSSYWKDEPYLGIGPSAHSYNGISRQWNIANNALYIKQIAQNIIPCEIETLSATERINERIMIALRTSEGLNLAKFNLMIDEYQKSIFNRKVSDYIRDDLLKINNNEYLRLTQKGKLFADGIASELFF